jgi:hypothetical protein
MGLPRAPEARQYYRAAKQRFLEAELLFKAGMLFLQSVAEIVKWAEGRM